MSLAMEGSRAARRRQLADLYQAGNEDPLLRRRRPRKVSSKPAKSRVCREKEMVRREKEKALYGSIAETVQFGQRRAWHYGYRNNPGLSGSGPVAASARYGAIGTLRMIRRDASAARGGSAPREDDTAEDFQVDEWSPMLRCSTAPSLATTTTPKAWPESAMYPHGSQPKRLQPSPWYDGETTANEVVAATPGPGMRRVAASHGFTMSILERDALLETTNADPGARGPSGATRWRLSSATESGRGGRGPRGPGEGKAVASHTRTSKRLDQEMGFLNVGVYFTAPKDPLRHGLGAALAERLVRQTDQDGLKWDLLKQVLRVVTGSQHGLPAQAVKEVAATFGAVVGTSKLATKAQFVDHITGNHVGFPESELTTLFGFFRSPMRVAGASSNRPPSQKWPNNATRKGSGGVGESGGADGSAAQQGADWTVAVACLRLLARPKEPVMASALGVFDVFARARGDRARHARRQEQERLERERQELLEEERERWKRRRRREQERGIAPSAQSLASPETRTDAPLARESHRAGEDGEAPSSSSLNRASFSETARMFTLVCSNDQERHAVTTTYRHRFRLELRAVMEERRSLARSKTSSRQHHAESGNGSPEAEGSSCPSPQRGSAPPKEPNSPRRLRHASEAHSVSHVGGRPDWSEAKDRGDACGRGSPGDGETGVTAEEFSEALVRCPEMLEAFGSQLAARFRHRHRPVWMAPILRKGG